MDKNDRGSEKPERGRGGRKSEPKDGRAAQKLLYSLLDTIQSHQHGAVFQNPVKKVGFPLIAGTEAVLTTRATRLRITISSKNRWTRKRSDRESETARLPTLISSRGTSCLCLREWVIQLVDLADGSNAMMYNEEGSQVYEMAMDMLRESENHIAHYRTMQDDLAR